MKLDGTDIKQEYSQTIKIDAGDLVEAVAFTANGEYVVSGGYGGVQVWRVKDGERVATMKAGHVCYVTVSKDGRFIAAGSLWGDVLVWDGTTYERVFADKIPGDPTICDVDFSPDSSRLVSANERNNTAIIWGIEACQKVRTFDHHGQSVQAAKYSPQGDRIATVSYHSVRFWDSNDGQLLVDVKVGLKPWRSLLWFGKSHLLVKDINSKIRQIDASTGSTVSEWSVPHDGLSCIALPQHGKFIAYSTKDNITFWDTLTHTQLGFISRSTERRSIAFSPDHRLAIVSREKNIIIKTLSLVKV